MISYYVKFQKIDPAIYNAMAAFREALHHSQLKFTGNWKTPRPTLNSNKSNKCCHYPKERSINDTVLWTI